ncbi:MAG TPA: response regulator transcription factor [Terracidiphilus sp.]|jgi:DNA-binding NarL/FixJ family response regulator
MPISIVLADDHPIVRRGLQTVLEGEPDFSVIGVAHDGLGAVRITEQLKPDVMILDLMMPGLSGLEVLRILRERALRTRIVILSMYCSRAFVAQALQNGATGYVLKDSTENDLSCAVREAAAGRRFLSRPVSDTAISAYIELSKTSSFDPHETLTPRQREVLQLVAEGNTNAEIASRLNISQRTVENHRADLMQKLGLRNQTELIRHAMRHGLIPADE